MIVPLRTQIATASHLVRRGLIQQDPSGLLNLDERIAAGIIEKVPAIAALIAAEDGLDRGDGPELNQWVSEILS